MLQVWMDKRNQHIKEAAFIGNYLLNTSIRESEKNTYADALEKLNILFSAYEQTLWNEMLTSKRKMRLIDAGLSKQDPSNNARRKIFTMLAILEASPNYTSYFLSKQFSFFYLIKIGFVGIRGLISGMIGVMIVNKIKRKCL